MPTAIEQTVPKTAAARSVKIVSVTSNNLKNAINTASQMYRYLIHRVDTRHILHCEEECGTTHCNRTIQFSLFCESGTSLRRVFQLLLHCYTLVLDICQVNQSCHATKHQMTLHRVKQSHQTGRSSVWNHQADCLDFASVASAKSHSVAQGTWCCC